ncbi:hypothetical protein HDV00_006542, partial [Rhizophlyctis rosea]
MSTLPRSERSIILAQPHISHTPITKSGGDIYEEGSRRVIRSGNDDLLTEGVGMGTMTTTTTTMMTVAVRTRRRGHYDDGSGSYRLVWWLGLMMIVLASFTTVVAGEVVVNGGGSGIGIGGEKVGRSGGSECVECPTVAVCETPCKADEICVFAPTPNPCKTCPTPLCTQKSKILRLSSSLSTPPSPKPPTATLIKAAARPTTTQTQTLSTSSEETSTPQQIQENPTPDVDDSAHPSETTSHKNVAVTAALSAAGVVGFLMMGIFGFRSVARHRGWSVNVNISRGAREGRGFWTRGNGNGGRKDVGDEGRDLVLPRVQIKTLPPIARQSTLVADLTSMRTYPLINTPVNSFSGSVVDAPKSAKMGLKGGGWVVRGKDAHGPDVVVPGFDYVELEGVPEHRVSLVPESTSVPDEQPHTLPKRPSTSSIRSLRFSSRPHPYSSRSRSQSAPQPPSSILKSSSASVIPPSSFTPSFLQPLFTTLTRSPSRLSNKTTSTTNRSVRFQHQTTVIRYTRRTSSSSVSSCGSESSRGTVEGEGVLVDDEGSETGMRSPGLPTLAFELPIRLPTPPTAMMMEERAPTPFEWGSLERERSDRASMEGGG